MSDQTRPDNTPQYEPLVTGDTSWTVRREWLDFFRGPVDRDWMRPASWDSAIVVHSDPGLSVYELDVEPAGQPVRLLVKVYHHRRLRDQFLRLLVAGSAWEEWKALRRAEQTLLSAARPVAFGRRVCGGLSVETILVTEPAPGRPFREFLDRTLAAFHPVGRARTIRAGAESLGRFVAAMHRAGIHPPGFSADHLCVEYTAVEPRFSLANARRARLRRFLGLGDRMADLVTLGASLFGRASRSEHLRFFRAYIQDIPFLQQHFQGYCRAIQERVQSEHRRFLKRRRRMALGDNGLFRRVRVNGVVGHTVRAHVKLPPRVLAFIPEKGLAQPLAEAVKDDSTSTVWKQVLDLGECRFTIFVKHYHRRKALAPLWDLFRGSRARRGWRMGNGLLDRDIGAVRPLAMLERRWLHLLPTESWLVTEGAGETQPLSELVEKGIGPGVPERRALIKSLARWLRRLHEAGVSARDLKPQNLLVLRTETGVDGLVVDFDGMHLGREVDERTRMRDLARLARGSMGPAVHNTDRMRFLACYQGVRGTRAERHRWWQMIEAKVR